MPDPIVILEKRVRELERRLNALMRQQEDAQRLVSKSPLMGIPDALARVDVRISALENYLRQRPLAAHDAHVDRVIEDARRNLKNA